MTGARISRIARGRRTTTPRDEWRDVLRAATMRAERLLGGAVAGGASDDVLERARDVLRRIKASALRFSDPRADLPANAPTQGAVQRAARALAEGARDAARFAGQVKDDIAKDLTKLANDAAAFAFPSLALLALLYLATR